MNAIVEFQEWRRDGLPDYDIYRTSDGSLHVVPFRPAMRRSIGKRRAKWVAEVKWGARAVYLPPQSNVPTRVQALLLVAAYLGSTVQQEPSRD